MIVKRFGVRFFMVFDQTNGKIRFIRFKKWLSMNREQIKKFAW